MPPTIEESEMITINYGDAKKIELIEILIGITVLAIISTFFFRVATDVAITADKLSYICARISEHGN